MLNAWHGNINVFIFSTKWHKIVESLPLLTTELSSSKIPACIM